MDFILKGIEIENFKSYVVKQYIEFSDLTVLLGANSSGKSTALQALLVMKQTMESNSPDEELLLSGKYVALGDFDDVISDASKEYFVFSAVLKQTKKTENADVNDCFKLSWRFEKADDGISAILTSVNIDFENIVLEFKRKENGLYNIYVNGEQMPISAQIRNLLIDNYILHYDKELNVKAAELLNGLLRVLVSKKVATVATDEPVSITEANDFYYRLMDRLQTKEESQYKTSQESNKLARQISDLIDDYGKLEIPYYESIRLVSKDLRTTILDISIAATENRDELDKLISKHESFIREYKGLNKKAEQYTESYVLGKNLYHLFDYDEKEDNFTQLKYAIDFYLGFYKKIIGKIFFVGPIRENPKGLYNIGFETIPKYVGPTGSYFASVLLHESKKEKEYILPSGIEKCTLSDALAEWMLHLNIASAVNVDKKNSFGFSVSVENLQQVTADIMNVGIGTSQILPVLISVLLSEPDEILIFEQPELHLHPYSQSRLADLFAEYCKNGRKIILETHSEYFLLRLRYQIVKRNFDKESAAVNFFQNKGGTKVSIANISGYGNIEYPIDFRDETQELLDAIMTASLERKGWV